jgi:hypothetical protein
MMFIIDSRQSEDTVSGVHNVPAEALLVTVVAVIVGPALAEDVGIFHF